MELGLITFADLKSREHGEERLRQLVDEAVAADRAGLDVFGVGEHHRSDYAVSATAVALAAIAERTENLRLTSAVTVLGSDDPVRVYQQYATLDLLSGGRAEIIAGRGAFHESFPLFGYDLDDYDDLYAERLKLLLQIRDEEIVSWPGGHRAAIDNRGVYPRALREIPIWIAAGGTASSAERAATLGLPLCLALIKGKIEDFVPVVEAYHAAATAAGHDPSTLKVAANSHLYVGETSEAAREDYFPTYSVKVSRIAAERGGPPLTREKFDEMAEPDGVLMVGSPEEVTAKLARAQELLGLDRFLGNTGVGLIEHERVISSTKLLGEAVAPALAAVTAKA
jgi:probable LLM family oxidoreductase